MYDDKKTATLKVNGETYDLPVFSPTAGRATGLIGVVALWSR